MGEKTVRGPNGGNRASREKRSDVGCVAISRCEMEWRPALSVLDVRVGPELEEQRDCAVAVRR